jgi:hypothetical protein
MKGEIQKGNLEQAKKRCQNCFCLRMQGQDNKWYCDEVNNFIELVVDCGEWESLKGE